jgi:hypothetical protein
MDTTKPGASAFGPVEEAFRAEPVMLAAAVEDTGQRPDILWPSTELP